MHIGTITKLFCDKEYGLIEGNNGQEIHFHKHCLWDVPFDELKEGQQVEFEFQSSYKGCLGFHIRPYVKTKKQNTTSKQNNV